MSLTKLKTWSVGEILTAVDFNAEWDNLYNNAFNYVDGLSGITLNVPK